MMPQLTHIDAGGRARMVDVSGKSHSTRTAIARGRLTCSHGTLQRLRDGTAPKGAVVATAELAGVMAAKQTSSLIPLCHPLMLTNASVAITADAALPGFDILAEVSTNAQTGVEMEALTAVSVAALTLYDMLKAIDKRMQVETIHLVSKVGGKSGSAPLTPFQQCE